MKKLVLIALVGVSLFWSCSKDDECGEATVALITPEFRLADIVSEYPFTGALGVAPCEENSSIYFGNYNSSGTRTPIHALYTVGKGNVLPSTNPVRLPSGTYNFIYWGVVQNDTSDPTYPGSRVDEPVYILGEDMNDQYFKLYPNQMDTTYGPVYDYVYAKQSINIGVDTMGTLLHRVAAGLKVTLSGKDGSIDPNITSVNVQVGNIAYAINYYTGKASDFSKTISFPLSLSTDGNTLSTNSTVMLFPSAPNPPVTLVITMANGKTQTYRQNLVNTLSPGIRLTLKATIGDILMEETSPGNFNVTGWTEQTETVDF